MASVKLFRHQVEENVQIMTKMANDFSNMKTSQSKPRKKTSSLEYFIYSGTKVYGGLSVAQENLGLFYANLLKEISHLETRMKKCLVEQQPKVERAREHFEKEIKEYATYCYPETTSISFKLGLASSKKLVKKEDSFREKVATEEGELFVQLLQNSIH